MRETNIVQLVRLKCSQLGKVMWRNNRGKLEDKFGRWVEFGIGGDGGSDLIGYSRVTVTPDMVGQTIAVFTAYEVKTLETIIPKGEKQKKHYAEQQRFLNAIIRSGGIAKMICSPDEL